MIGFGCSASFTSEIGSCMTSRRIQVTALTVAFGAIVLLSGCTSASASGPSYNGCPLTKDQTIAVLGSTIQPFSIQDLSNRGDFDHAHRLECDITATSGKWKGLQLTAFSIPKAGNAGQRSAWFGMNVPIDKTKIPEPKWGSSAFSEDDFEYVIFETKNYFWRLDSTFDNQGIGKQPSDADIAAKVTEFVNAAVKRND